MRRSCTRSSTSSPPSTSSWGTENRTAAVRLIPGSAKSTRLEYRQTAADINPYLSIAACLGAGLYGVDKKLDPPAEASGDASVNAKLAPLPRTLKDAVDAFEKSKPVREVIGDAFVDHWTRTRRHEIARHERAVS